MLERKQELVRLRGTHDQVLAEVGAKYDDIKRIAYSGPQGPEDLDTMRFALLALLAMHQMALINIEEKD